MSGLPNDAYRCGWCGEAYDAHEIHEVMDEEDGGQQVWACEGCIYDGDIERGTRLDRHPQWRAREAANDMLAALRHTLEAINSGRSEPLYVAKDVIVAAILKAEMGT